MEFFYQERQVPLRGRNVADIDMDKRIGLDSLISRTYPFDELSENFRLMLPGEPCGLDRKAPLLYKQAARMPR
jgi:hypothetical protein